MVTWSKFAVGGLVTAVLVWCLLLPPWAASPDPAPPTPAPAANVAAAVTAPLAPPAATSAASQATTTPERLAAPAPADVTRLLVRGTVVDDATGAPLAAVPVRIITWPPRDPNPSTTTAADGTFTLRESRAQGDLVWQILVQAPDHATVRHPVARDANAPAPHEVDLGIIRLVPGTELSGQVVDTEGRPVPAAELLLPLLTLNYNNHRGPQGMLGRTASLGHSDRVGHFSLTEPIAPDSSHQNLLFALTEQGVGWGTFEASTQRWQVDDLVIRMRPRAALRVRVETPDGRPSAAARVRAIPRFGPIGIAVPGWRLVAPGPERLQRRLAGHTDAQGLLTFSDLFVGERDMHNAGGTEADYELWIEAPGYPQQPLHKVTLAPNTERQATVRLVAPRDLQVTVEVRDDLGAAIPDATVTATGTGPSQATTDAAGRATLTVRGTAKLTVAATAAGHQGTERELPVDATAPLPPVQLVLVRTMPLDGTVVDQHGRPTAGLDLFVDRKLVASTDAEGRFHIAAFPRGERPLQVAIGKDLDPIGWTGLQQPTRVDAARGPVTILMERRPGAIDVQVAITDAVSGAALEPIEANLRIFAYGGFYFAKRVATASGFVRAQGAPAGRWQLAVRTAAGHQGVLEFELAEGQPPAALRLELPPPGTIAGRLQFVEVDPPTTLTIDVRHATQRALSGVRHPGRWQVEAGSQSLQNDRANGGGWSGTGQLRMEPARNATFRLEMADPGDELVFTVQGAGIRGEARVRVEPGQTRELVLEVRKQPQ